MLLVITELMLWHYDKAIFFTNQSEVYFGIALVFWSLSQNKIQQWAAYGELAKNKQYLFNRARHT
jgi:hypothetical protein